MSKQKLQDAWAALVVADAHKKELVSAWLDNKIPQDLRVPEE